MSNFGSRASVTDRIMASQRCPCPNLWNCDFVTLHGKGENGRLQNGISYQMTLKWKRSGDDPGGPN